MKHHAEFDHKKFVLIKIAEVKNLEQPIYFDLIYEALNFNMKS